MPEGGADITVEEVTTVGTTAAGDVAAAENAQRRGDFAGALELFQEAPATAGPVADLCLKSRAATIASTRSTRPSLGSRAWWTPLTPSSPGARPRRRWRGSPSAPVRRPRAPPLAVTRSYTTSQLAAMLPLAALRQGVGLSKPMRAFTRSTSRI